jgi:hypothetical protein
MFVKPHTTHHSPASKTGKLMGKSSARLSLTTNAVCPIETDEEGFAAVRGLIAYATTKKLPIYPGSPCFLGEESFVPRTPAEVLALVTTAETAGMNCWLSKRGNVSIGVRPVDGEKPKVAPRPMDKNEDAALAAFMKSIG